MRYRVKFRYREDTGEVEAFRVETTEPGIQAPDHDAQHDRVAAEVAGVVERDAEIEEVQPTDVRREQSSRPASEEEARAERGRSAQLDG